MFEMLREGLEDILDHQKGKKRLKVRVIDIPEPADDVRRIHESPNYPLECTVRRTRNCNHNCHRYAIIIDAK